MKKVRLNSPKPIGFFRAYYAGKAVSGNFLSSGHEKHFDVLDMQSLQLQKAVAIPESEYLEALKKLGEVRSNHVFLADCYFDSPADELDFERIKITDAVFFPKQIPGFMPEGRRGLGKSMAKSLQGLLKIFLLRRIFQRHQNLSMSKLNLLADKMFR